MTRRRRRAELARMAAELQNLVGQFKYRDSGESAQPAGHGNELSVKGASNVARARMVPPIRPAGAILHTL